MSRIQELGVEAGLISAEYNGFDRTNLSAAEKKFAELLLREASEVVASNPNIGTSLASSRMLEHFGIKSVPHEILYSEEYDTYYDPRTDQWTESKCNDPTCEYCTRRPARPSQAGLPYMTN